MNTIAVINQKGGVGKSTTAQQMGAWLTRHDRRVLLVDIDPQRNLSYMAGADGDGLTVVDVLTEKASASEAVQKFSVCDVIPASASLVNASFDLTGNGKEYRLKRALDSLSDQYDDIIIDTPPALSILTVNALTAADQVIIPAQADPLSLQGIADLKGTIEATQAHSNTDLKIAGILITRYNRRTRLSRVLLESFNKAAKVMATKVFKTKIRECTALKEAATVREDIFTYKPRSNAAKDYNAFMTELVNSQKEG